MIGFSIAVTVEALFCNQTQGSSTILQADEHSVCVCVCLVCVCWVCVCLFGVKLRSSGHDLWVIRPGYVLSSKTTFDPEFSLEKILTCTKVGPHCRYCTLQFSFCAWSAGFSLFRAALQAHGTFMYSVQSMCTSTQHAPGF